MPETDPPSPEIETPRTETSRRLSLVWLVPLAALLIALAVAWRAYSDRGPLVEIVFQNAAGIEAGQTQVRFRDVNVGMVERTELSDDLTRVVVGVRIDKEVAHFLDDSAKFWVVRPSVSAQGVSGIETVISGVYIGAYWDDQIGARKESFVGLESAPLTPGGQSGLRVRLRAPDGGSMTVGAPVLYKRIEVGQIEKIDLTPGGDVTIDLFINAPYSDRVTQGARFWNASGFSIELGAGGASLNVDSLISLLRGGVSFDTVGSDLSPVEEGHEFELYASESAARQNLVENLPGERVELDVNFEDSLRGLQPGASVEYQGVKVGDVKSIQAVVVGETDAPRVILRATLAIAPQRLGLGGEPAGDASGRTLDLLSSAVRQGLRARLASKGLLGQTLSVELVTLPDAPPAELDRTAVPNPILPSAPAETSGVAASAQNVLDRITELPLEDLLDAAVTLISNVNALVTDDRVKSAPENLGLLLADLRSMLDESGIKEAPAQLTAVLTSVRALVDQATEAQLVQNLNGVLATTKASVASIGTAADGVPALLDEIEALSRKAGALPLDELATSATRLVDNLDAFVTSEDVATLPASVQSSLGELRGAVADLRQGGAVDNLNATFASVRQMTEDAQKQELVAKLNEVLASADVAADTVNAAAVDVPALVDELSALTAKANALPLEELVASTDRLINSTDALVSSDGVTGLPATVQASIEDLRGVVRDLREGGAIDNVNASLASVRQITDEVARARLTDSIQSVVADAKAAIANLNTATEGAPALVDQLNQISAKVNALPLDELVATGNDMLRTADAFLGSQGVQDVPPKLAASLEELRAILAELRSRGAAENVSATFDSAARAADALTAATTELPALIARFNDVADKADAALDSVGPNSSINRDTLLLLQEVRNAARSVNALANALERRPNSVLFGR